jgi:hypothetical protein
MAYNRILHHFTSSQELANLWEAGQSYLENQIVLYSNALYKSNVSHTSSGSFITDLTAGKWTGISAAGGSGDFMADGSVPMTGNLDMGTNSIQNASQIVIAGANYDGRLVEEGLGITLKSDANLYLLADFLGDNPGSQVISQNEMSLSSQKIVNLADPDAAQDAATKNYVDNAVSSVTVTGTPFFFSGFDLSGNLGPVTGWAFDDNGSVQIGAQNSITVPVGVTDYTSISISPTVSNAGLNNLSAVQVNSPIDEVVANYNPIQVFGYGTSAPDNFSAYSSQTNYDGIGSNITHYTASGSSSCSGTSIGFKFDSTGGADTIKGMVINPSGNATTLDGVSFTPSGTYTNLSGLKVDLSLATSTNRAVGLDITGGSLNSSLTFSTTSSIPSIVDSGNVIRPIFEVQSGFPITETDVIMSNLAGFMDFKDDYSKSSALGLGASSVGFVSQIAVSAGKSVSDISMLTAGFAIDATSDGGFIEKARLIRVFTANFGGSVSIDAIYGLQVEDGLSALANLAFGISVEDSNAENYLAKSLKISGSSKQVADLSIGLEIDDSKTIKLANASAGVISGLPNIPGTIIYDSDLNTLSINNGSGWINLGGGTGSGDFMANGSVPMTGQLNVGGFGIAQAGNIILGGTVIGPSSIYFDPVNGAQLDWDGAGQFTISSPNYIDLNASETIDLLANAGNITVTAQSGGNIILVPDGAVSVSSKKITDLADPDSDQDAATKLYVDLAVADIVYSSVAAVSSNTTLTNGNSIVLATGGAGGITVTLPAPTSGKIFNIKKVDAGVGVITISPPSGTIDGAASKTLTTQYDSLTITSDGTNFFII